MNNIIETEEIKDPKLLLNLISIAKNNIKSEYIVIPRLLFQSTYKSSILGLSNGTRLSIMQADSIPPSTLWNNNKLPYIQLEVKSLLTYNKLIKELNQNELTMYLQYKIIYINTNKTLVIGTNLITPLPNNMFATIPLLTLNIDQLRSDFDYVLSRPKILSFDIDLNDKEHNQGLLQALEMKSSNSGVPWIPEFDNQIYPEYLFMVNSNTIKINKGDKLHVNIYHPFKIYEYFIIEFNIIKKNKIIVNHYYVGIRDVYKK